MIEIETALNFFVINLSICLIPCVEMVIVITQSATNGWKSGMSFSMGICCALIIQVLLMAFGVSAIIQTSEVLFHVLKIIGVCYLLYLAYRTLFDPVPAMNANPVGSGDLRGLFRKGFILNFSTPLTPLFLLVFIPPFIKLEQGGVFFQSLQLGFLMILSIIVGYSVFSFGAQKLGGLILTSHKLRTYLQRGAGATIAGFAAYLALAQQSI